MLDILSPESSKGSRVALNGLAQLAVNRVELHGANDLVLLGLDSNQEEPLLHLVCAVVDDLAFIERRVAIEHLLRLRVSLHGPMVDAGLGYQGDGVEADPLPEDDSLRHVVGFHFALHLQIEDLKRTAGWQ